MKTLEQRQWRRFGVVIVDSEHISYFVLIIDFAQANAFEGKIEYIMRHVLVFSV